MAIDGKIMYKTIPEEPGVYQFFNKENNIIYVGKAKNLKKRVSSYFQKSIKSRKTINLVKNIDKIEHAVVYSESDALLLENSLIKKNQPKYNILLRDDKTYPWICVKNERFPRIYLTRKVISDGSEYFGPYTNVKYVYILLNLINNLYPIRSSNYNFSPNKLKKINVPIFLNIYKKKGQSIILNFSYEKAKDSLSEENYNENISSIKKILKGNLKDVRNLLKERMLEFSKRLQYEDAQKIKENLLLLENYQSKSTVVSNKLNNIDVFSIVSDSEYAYTNYLQIAHGRIIRFQNKEIKKKLDEKDTDILSLVIIDSRERFKSNSNTIISNYNLSNEINTKFIVPKLGDKMKLLNLSIKNAKSFRVERLKQVQILDPEKHSNRILNQLKIDLKMENIPSHIECFDISNIQGTNTVAACVVFINAKPSKSNYRKYNIKSVSGPDDFASMQEVVFRRYRRLIDEKKSLPQLIIIDGGKGQLSSALKSLKKLNIESKVTIVGIAKRLEEIYFPGDSIPLYLNKKSESLKIIQNLRNEAHRFGIEFHKSKRIKNAMSSIFDNIDGIGEKTKNKLLKKYKSLSIIKKLSFDEIKEEIGSDKAKKILNALEKI
ncbi:MAG: excinuclease ABC subunit C [Flavobacteriales bacterium]|jgi:excinuclease ABC subunit C|nr:excinuclease ABC subunit C [Flavobacteriales bacterium]|tara:strand:- start:1237 stop:3051 length:1815 start_codon:yes stop_codon:yes gene_type:complete